MSEMEIILQEIKSLRSDMNKRLDKIENRLDNMEEQIEEIRHDGRITRVATNRIGEMLEEHLMVEHA